MKIAIYSFFKHREVLGVGVFLIYLDQQSGNFVFYILVYLFKVCLDFLELVQILDSGLHEANFISCFVKIFAVSPAYGCKFCLA